VALKEFRKLVNIWQRHGKKFGGTFLWITCTYTFCTVLFFSEDNLHFYKKTIFGPRISFILIFSKTKFENAKFDLFGIVMPVGNPE